MKRPILYWVILFMLGEVFVKYCSVGWMGILGIVSVGGIRICRQSYVKKNQMLLMSGILFFVLGGISFCYVERQHDICDVENGTSLSFYGKISDIEKKDDAYQYRVATTLLDDNNMRVHILIEQETEFAIGTWIRGNGIVQQFSQSTNPGGFDESAYQFGKGNYLRLTHVEILSIKASVFSIKAYLYRIKNYMIQIYYRLFSETDASLACAMVLGERSNLDTDTKLLYQRNGIAHLIAISGVKTQNLAIPLTRRIRINSAFVPLHIAKIYILKLCLDEEIIPPLSFPLFKGVFQKMYKLAKETII